MQGAPKDELLSTLYTPVPGMWERRPLTPKVAGVASGSFGHKTRAEIRGSGYVVASLEAALWAFSTTNDFREGCLAAVNLGDDADTTTAIYGQIAGAVYGEKAIPEQWVAKLAKGDVISDLGCQLLRVGD